MTAIGIALARSLAPIDRAYSVVPTILSYLASSSIVFMMLMICADIFMRFFFNAPITGVAEIIANLIVTAVFLQFGSTIRDGRLIRADFVMGHWSRHKPALARVADIVFFSVGALAMAAALSWLARDFAEAYRTNEFTGAAGAYIIQLWPFKLGVVVGCAAALIECLRAIAQALLELRWRSSAEKPMQPSLKRDGFSALLFPPRSWVSWRSISTLTCHPFRSPSFP